MSDGLDPPTAFATPEFAFVVAATAWPFDEAQADRLRALLPSIGDGARLVAIVDRHRVAGLVSGAIAQAGIVLPDPWQAAIAQRARANALTEMKLLGETLRLAGLFEVAGIDHKVVKGVTTAVAVFGRFGLRYSLDIDIAVPQGLLAEAGTVLRHAGYVRIEPAEDAGPAELRARLARHKDHVFEHAETGIVVELHWRLFTNAWIYPAADRSRTVPQVLVPGRSVATLPQDVAQLYLCFHGAEHAWARLKWLADLAAIVAADPGAATRLYDRARAMGRHRLVGPGLHLCHRLYGHPLPRQLLADWPGDWRMRAIAATAFASLVGDEDGVELEDKPLATTRKNLAHYLVVNDPRHLWSELTYDLAYRGDEDRGRSRVARLAARLWRLGRGERRRAPA